MRSRSIFVALATAALTAVFSLPFGCGADSGSGSGPGNTFIRLDASPDVPTLDGGSLFGDACETNAQCGDGRFCSVTKTCVADGACLDNGDCTTPATCATVSRVCLAPGACAMAGDCAEGQTCNPMGMCEIGGMCGASEFGLTQIAPNLVILLDRSGSMGSNAGNDSRWNVAKNAIASVTTAFDAQIRFGLATYSSCMPGGCAAGSIVIPLADNNASAINTFLGNTVDEGSSDGTGMNSNGMIQYLCDSGDPETSTGKSLDALVGEPSLQDATRANAVILLTDGEESGACVDGCDGACGAGRLLAQEPPVRTYVIGLGINSDTIDAIAAAGDTSESVPADDQAELNAAFAQIAAEVATCEYALDDTPPEPDKLFVFFNDDPEAVPEDATNGWSYDTVANTLTFNGTTCDDIMTGTVMDIDVVFGCSMPVVE